MAQNSAVPVKASRTTMTIVEALSETDGMGVSALAQEIEMPKSTVHDHLVTLERSGYLLNDGETYRLSSRFLELGGYTRSRNPLFKTAYPEIDELANETGEHANLMIEEDGFGVFLYVGRGPDTVTVDAVHHTGMHVYLHTTALGKSILAHLPAERVDEIIAKHGLPAANDRTITDRDALFDELENIRQQGYSTDDQERIDGMRCIAVPIVTREDGVVGAISISGPISRMQGEYFENELPKMIQQKANIIEVNLNYA